MYDSIFEYEDLKEKAPCGMLINYTVDKSTDLVTYTDINDRGKGAKSEKCKNCSWRGICQPTEPEKHMSHDLFVQIRSMISSEIEKEQKKRETAIETLASDNLTLSIIATGEAIRELRETTQKLQELNQLLEKFDKEVQEPVA